MNSDTKLRPNATLRCPNGHFKLEYSANTPSGESDRHLVNSIGTPAVFAQNGNVCPQCGSDIEVRWVDG